MVKKKTSIFLTHSVFVLMNLFIELKCVEDVIKEDKFTPMVPPSTTITAMVGVRSSSTIRTTTTNRVIDDQYEEDVERMIPSPPPTPTQQPPRRQQMQPQPSLSRPSTEAGPPPRLTSPSPATHR
jgi:hypothetical protein